MNINNLKILFDEFGKKVEFDYDLKKRIGLILEEKQKFISKLTI